jgi:endoglucanase
MELKDFTALTGVAGNETQVRDAIMKELTSMGVKFETDVLGNVIARKGDKGPKVLIDAHMDEVGLMVVFVEKNGFLRFTSIGVPASVLVSKRVYIGKDKVPGVIGAKAIHLQQPKERETVIPVDQLFIDIGARSAEEAGKKVKVGDYVVFDTEFEELSPGVYKAKAFDDRAGCSLLFEALKQDWKGIQLCAVFATQEEVGLRGARIAAYRVAPDMGIALEGTVCADIPLADKDSYATVLGGGAVVSVMDRGSIATRSLVEQLAKLAKENDIPFQFREATSGGNDAGAIQSAQAGCPVAAISVPCRYIHTPFAVMSKKDFDAARALLLAFLTSVEGGFRP